MTAQSTPVLDIDAMKHCVEYFADDKRLGKHWSAYSYEGTQSISKEAAARPGIHRHSVCIEDTETGEHRCVATAYAPNDGSEAADDEEEVYMVARMIELFASPPNARRIIEELLRLRQIDTRETSSGETR